MRRIALFASVALLAVTAAAPAAAQQDDRRIADLQKQVRELRSIVFQGRDTGQPVEVKPVGPDPIVTSLQSKVDDLEQSLRLMNGQNEVLTHQLDEARRGLENERAKSAAGRQALSDRIAKLETAQAAIAAAQTAPPPPEDFGAATQPLAESGPLRRPRAEAPASPAELYNDAAARLAAADYGAAQAGFEAYLAAEPNGARASEARYSIGQSFYARENYTQAARAYALALKGWPASKWAPDATVRLAASLNEAGRKPDACGALGEFDRRYAKTAVPAVKTRAASVRRAAACGAG
jgi:TolA-binding protein